MTRLPSDPPAPGEPPGPPDGLEPPWEALEDLAAGWLPPPEALALRARISGTPGWAAAYARVEALGRALDAEGLYPFPRALAARIVSEVVAEGPRLGLASRVARVAAAVALAVGAWSAWLGGAPSLPHTAGVPSWARAPVELPGSQLLDAAPRVPGAAAPWAALGALGLLTGGLWLARRWGTGPAHDPGRSAA